MPARRTGPACARSPDSTSTWAGLAAPGPAWRAASSAPSRVSLSLGNWRSAPSPVSSDRAGMASASISAALAPANSSGRRMTVSVQRCQKPGRWLAGSVEPGRRRRQRTARADQAEHGRRAPARVGALAQHAHQRRQQGHGGQDRDRHDHDRPHGHRADRGGVDQEQAGQRDDHGDAREQDGDARRVHRGPASGLGLDARRAPPRGSGPGGTASSPPPPRCRSSTTRWSRTPTSR